MPLPFFDLPTLGAWQDVGHWKIQGWDLCSMGQRLLPQSHLVKRRSAFLSVAVRVHSISSCKNKIVPSFSHTVSPESPSLLLQREPPQVKMTARMNSLPHSFTLQKEGWPSSDLTLPTRVTSKPRVTSAAFHMIRIMKTPDISQVGKDLHEKSGMISVSPLSVWFVFFSGQPAYYIGLSILKKGQSSPQLLIMPRDKTGDLQGQQYPE